MNKNRHRFKIYPLLLFVFAFFFFLVGTELPATLAQESDTAEQIIAEAWELVQDSGRYSFDTRIDQTTYPLPSLTNAGRAPEQQEVTLAGVIDRLNKTAAFTLWQGTKGLPEQGLNLRSANGRTEQRLPNGTWETVNQNTDLFAPDNDPLIFIETATNIQEAGVETRQLGEHTLTYSRYTFEIDAAAYSTLMRQRVEQHLQKYGTLPSGLNVQTPDIYRNMSGRGELLLDTAGLPNRLTLDLEFPAQDSIGRTQATLISDFHSYNRSRIAQAQIPFWQNPQSWWSLHEATMMLGVRQAAVVLTLIFALAALVLLAVSHWQRPEFHTLITAVLVFAIVAGPLLQGRQAHAFTQNLNDARAAQELEEAEAALATAARDQLRDPNFDPNQPADEQQIADNGTAADPLIFEPAAAVAENSATVDTDGDGLPDDEEDEWLTCAYLGAPENCDGVTDPTDSDGDGLKDNIEVYNLTTHPGRWDTDGDNISDTLEVNGFSYNGRMWYLNPDEPDTNKDGLVDAIECSVWSANGEEFDAAAPCPDTDGDGTPDFWDDDNDNDNVVDAVDLSPFTAGSEIYTHDDPLTVQIDGLQPDLPIFVDVQFRPQNPDHLNYIGTVLDWPSGDTAGQIQRHLDTTFATTNNPDLLSNSSLANNGDVRLVPMAEIRIPYTAGHYGNLPLKPAYQGTERMLGVPVDAWLDKSKLAPYGISVRDADDSSGELIAYLPLSAVTDDTGGGREAYAFRMLYWPEQVDGQNLVNWAAPHEYRILWMVQMITDECLDPTDDPDTCARQDQLEIIHVYKEAWRITGLEIREDHGLDVGVLYEDPTQDNNLSFDDELWVLSWNLNNQFLRGRDCDTLSADVCQSDGQRDVTLANMEAQINSWSGDTDAIEMRTFSYDHQGFIAHIMMTETLSLLDSVFTPAGVTTPTLMFAREETYRSYDLGQGIDNGGAGSFDLETAPELIMANMSWAPYQSVSGSWQNRDLSQTLDEMRRHLEQVPFFQAADESQSSMDEAAGKLIWAEIYYTALYRGLSTAVAVNDTPLWEPDYGQIPETEYATLWPPSTFAGASFVAFAYLEFLSMLASDELLGRTFWELLEAGLSKSYTTGSLNRQFSGLRVANNILFGVATAAAVVGIILFSIGYFSGDAKLQRTGEIILNATAAVIVGITMANFVVGLHLAYQAANTSAKGLEAMLGFSKQNRSVGTVGLLIQLGVVWGAFLITALSTGLFNHPNSIAFNMALAYAIAQTIVIIILYVIDLIPIVGPLIVLTLILVEAILSFFKIKGAQAWVTEKIAESLYDVDFIVRNLDSSDRLDFKFIDINFQNDEAGFTTAQSVDYSMRVTNTLEYAGGHGAGKAKEATFRYFLQSAPTDQHDNLDLKEMQGEWYGAGNKKIATDTEVTLEGGPIHFSDVGTGINRDLGGYMFLTESFVTPYVGCWLAVGINVDCKTYSYDGSVHIDVGEFSTFDILPETLSEFYRLRWSQNTELLFPRQVDQDGDGLRIGVDPAPTDWDGDGDGLTDYYELANGYNPYKVDADGDGMTDREEIRRGLNPHNADIDDDGLNDKVEWEGWQVAYDYDESGNALLTWAWPNPYQADSDGDTLTDIEEYFFALHPLIPSSIDTVLNTIQFSEGTVSEQGAPELLLRFDEARGATSFLDNAAGQRAFCQDTHCPTAEEPGRYNHALLFDGTDDYLTAPAVLDPSATPFTIAAWFNLTEIGGTNRTIVQQTDGTGTGRTLLFVDGSSEAIATAIGGISLAGSTAVTTNKWHHAAVTYNGSTVRLFLNGQLEATATRTAESSDGALLLGIHKNLSQNAFSGHIDEVAVYDSVLFQAAINSLAAAHYNVTDKVVAPEDTLDFQLTVSNTNPVHPAQVVYYGEADQALELTEEVPPAYRIYMDESAGATSFDIEGLAADATCNDGAGACPTAGVPGIQNTALSFDGDDVLFVNPLANNFNGKGFTISFAFYPEAAGNKQFRTLFSILDSNGGNAGNDYRFRVSYDLDNQECCGGVPNILPNTWYTATIVADQVNDTVRIFIDGVEKRHYEDVINLQAGNRVRIGGVERSDFDNDSNWRGRIDNFVFFDRVLSAEQVQTFLAGGTPVFPILPTADVYAVPAQSSTDLSGSFTIPAAQPSGTFVHSQLAEAALDIPDITAAIPSPALSIHFDEPDRDPSALTGNYTVYGGTSVLYCQNNCPTFAEDFAGKAAVFDGANDQLREEINLPGPWTISAWIYPTHNDSTVRGIIGNRDVGFPSMYITSDDKLGLAFHDGTNWNTDYTAGGNVPRNEWSQVAISYDGVGNYQAYLNGEPVGNDTAVSGLTPNVTGATFRLANVGTGYENFEGRMDNVMIYDAQLNESEIAAFYSSEDLSLHLHYTLDEPPGSNVFTDNSGIYGDGNCTNCPALGVRGPVNRSAYFENNDLIRSMPIPDYWADYIDNYTIAAWVKAEYGSIVENKSANRSFRLWTDKLQLDPDCDGCGQYGYIRTFPRAEATEWTHVVYVYDPTSVRRGLYINGVFVDAYDGGSPFDPPDDQLLRIGQLLKGYVDDVRLYNRSFSAADVLHLYETTRPQLQLEFEEDGSALIFADQSPNKYEGSFVNAIPGLAGRVGNGVLLDGNGYVDLGPAPEINNLTDSFTIMGWIRPEKFIPTRQVIAGAGFENSRNGFIFGLLEDELWLGNGSKTVRSGDIGLVSNNWQHVAAVVNSSGDVRFYLNGDLVGNTGNVPITPNGDDNFYLGGRPLGSDNIFGQFYTGQIDELYIYFRPMPAAEIESNYNNQFRWFRKQVDTYFTVDNDVPTITLQTTQQYWPNSYIQLAVGTTDATSAIWSFEYGLKAPGEGAFTWQSAPACADVSIGTVWCPYFDPSVIAGEGEYQLRFRAVDSVGNETISPIYSLYVDDTPPAVTSDDDGRWRTPTADPTTELSWLLALSGTVSDPNLAGGGIAGSGVYAAGVTIQLFSEAGSALGEPQLAAVSGTNWTLDYSFTGRPHGRYYIQITAADNMGNEVVSAASTSTVLLDVRPSSVDTTHWLLPSNVISHPLTLSGLTSELPIWSNSLARYHFEETAGTIFYDHSLPSNHATCTACPAAINGPFGQALSFDGVDDSVDTPFLFNPITETFTIALWFNPDGASSGTRTLVQQADSGRTLLFLTDSNRLRSNLGLGTTGGFGGTTAVTADEWHHVALVYDGTTAQIYLDGRLDAAATVSGEEAASGLSLGVKRGVSNFFLGEMDELMVFGRALSAGEIEALATQDNAGVSGVDVWVEPFNFDNTSHTPDWQAATVTNPLTNLSSWEYTLPAGLQDFYQINVRGDDDFGNLGREGTVWRGIIDMIPPTVSLAAAHLSGGSAAQTEISVTASDPFLDLSALDLPCPADSWQTTSYEADQSRMASITATCRIAGHETEAITAEVCDLAGHCTTDSVTPTLSLQLSGVLIITPTQNAVISGTQPAISIGGGAFDEDGIETVAVYIDDDLFDTAAFGGVITDTMWNTAAWEPQQNGWYTLTAVMTNSLNGVITDTISVYIDLLMNTAPVAADDVGSTDENTAVVLAVLANDSDTDGDMLSIAAVSQPMTGTAVISASTIVYTPNSGFRGTDTFTYTVSDGNGGADSATVTVLVAQANTPPTADAGGPYTVTAGEAVLLDASGTVDAEQNPLTLSYTWDFDGDGQYDDGAGITTTFSTVALHDPETIIINLQVIDAGGLTSTDTAEVTVVHHGHQLYLPLIIR